MGVALAADRRGAIPLDDPEKPNVPIRSRTILVRPRSVVAAPVVFRFACAGEVDLSADRFRWLRDVMAEGGPLRSGDQEQDPIRVEDSFIRVGRTSIRVAGRSIRVGD